MVWNLKYAHPSSYHILKFFYEEARIVNSFDYRPVEYLEYSFYARPDWGCTYPDESVGPI